MGKDSRRPSVTVAFLLMTAFVLVSALAPLAHAQTVVATVPVRAGPWDAAYDLVKGEVFTTDNGASTVSVISNAVVASAAGTSAVASAVSSAVASATIPTSLPNLLPPSLAPYSSIIATILIFADGLLVGFAVKKALLSAILIVAALLLAGFIGLTLPFPGSTDILTTLMNTLTSQAKTVGPQIFALPIFWVIGLAIGFWKG